LNICCAAKDHRERAEPRPTHEARRPGGHIARKGNPNRVLRCSRRFDLKEREWREVTPERGDRPAPRHGAAIAPLAAATHFDIGTLLMSFGRDIEPTTRKSKLFREIWRFGGPRR
jgi:hypothetical protein